MGNNSIGVNSRNPNLNFSSNKKLNNINKYAYNSCVIKNDSSTIEQKSPFISAISSNIENPTLPSEYGPNLPSEYDSTLEPKYGPYEPSELELYLKSFYGNLYRAVEDLKEHISDNKPVIISKETKAAFKISTLYARTLMNAKKSKITFNSPAFNYFSRVDVYAKEFASDELNGMKEFASEKPDYVKEFWDEEGKDYKKFVHDIYKNAYKAEMHNINKIDKELSNLGKAMNNEIASANGDQTKISNIYQKYQSEFEQLEGQRNESLSRIAGDGDPNKVKVEKEILGNTQSEIASYGSQSIWVAGVSFLMKSGTTFFSTYISALKADYLPNEALELSVEALKDESNKALFESGLQGVGNFTGLLLSKGNTSWGSASGIAVANFASLAFDLGTAKDTEERKAILDSKLGSTIWGSAGALASAPIEPISGNTGSIVGKDIYQVGKWVKDYDSLGDFAANVSGSEVSSKILELTGATVGDLIEYAIFHKSTGILSTTLSVGGSLAGDFFGKVGENLGELAYDVNAEFTDCWKIGYSGIKKGIKKAAKGFFSLFD